MINLHSPCIGANESGLANYLSHPNNLVRATMRRLAAKNTRTAPAPVSVPESMSVVQELTRANRRKDEYLALVSHELRGPLATIKNATALLRSSAVQVPDREKAQALIERQLHKMTILVDDLLDASRIIHKRLRLQCERIDLRTVVHASIEALQSDITEKAHKLSVELPAEPVWVQADPCRLEQVFTNLLANAARYTNPGGELTVWLHTREGQAVVRVRDSGIGITPEALPHVFDLFQQAHVADRRSNAGLGIGLALVRDLVGLHGGSVLAASAGAGCGSEFTVRLQTVG